MTLQVLIPCKSFGTGKSRLSTMLDTKERRALCADFLRATLTLGLSLVPSGRCHVVTDDPEAKTLVTACGAAIIDDPGGGLNAALDAARAHLCGDATADTAILVLPIDLPLATATAMRELLADTADVAIAPDRARTGTNALYLGPAAACRFPFRFGRGSFALHCEAAAAARLSLHIVESAALAFDVDRSADYREWQRQGGREASARASAH
jgi:2-phospho-L-lactate guanylyltransferase